MEIIDEATCKLNEERGLVYKKAFIQSLSKDEYKNGLIKILIPAYDEGMCGESLWAWIYNEDKLKYLDDNFAGTIKAIICNTPLNFMDSICCFTEVEIECRKDKIPIISDNWVKEHIINTDWYHEL